jgi:orotidine-5'-phosphate decarboxylase
MDPRERIILALDVGEFAEAIETIKKFGEDIDIFKVGSELFTSAGPDIVREIHSMGKKVFLDLKFHDIPNTVSKAALTASKLGVFMFTLHTMGGFNMMKSTVDTIVRSALKGETNRPRILGVTILTSIDKEALSHELGIPQSMSTQVRHLAKMALSAGLDGVVASPQETEMIRSRCGPGFIIVTPGIRPSWAPPDDQRRTLTPKEAVRKGSDYLVIGRSVLSRENPVQALKRIKDEIARA